MSAEVSNYESKKNVPLEDALDATGFGKFNFCVLFFCGFLMAGMLMETLGFSYIIPASQCDLKLNNSMKGWVAAIPFTGFVLTSHLWGYIADTFGRRRAIFVSTSIGSTFSVISSLSPEVYSFLVLRFISALFIAGGSAIGYAFLGEFVPATHRDKMVSLASSSVVFATAVVPGIAWLILPLDFNLPFFMDPGYRPWRALIVCFALPFAMCAIMLIWLPESPKFLYSQRRYEEALEVLQKIYKVNNGSEAGEYIVSSLLQEEQNVVHQRSALVNWFHQSVDIFKPPFTGYAFLFCFLQFMNFGLDNGYYLWMPDIINKISQFEEDTSFCNIMTNVIPTKNNMECDDMLNQESYSVTIIIALLMTLLSVAVSFLMRITGKRSLILTAFAVVTICTLAVHWVVKRNMSVALVFSTQITNATIGLVNAAVVEIFPTKMRAMAICVSIMMGRIGAMVFSKGIGTLLHTHCSLCLYITTGLSALAAILSWFVPATEKQAEKKT